MATSTNFGWELPDDTDLVKDGAAAMRTLGNSIDTSFVDLKGGTTGQVLSKASNTDLDYSWIAVDPLTILDAKGDLISATAADTPARLAVGTNGQVLTADSTTSTGIKWATPAGGGKVLQVVSATNTATQSTTSTTFVDAITVSITPTASTSKVLVMAYISGASDTNATQIGFRLARGGTGIFVGDASGSRTQATGVLFQPANTNYSNQAHASFLDSPATTSATTYAMQYKVDTGASSTIYLGRTYADNNQGYTVRTPSAGIIVMEIGA